MANHDIAIIGTGAVFPSSEFGKRFSTPERPLANQFEVSRKLKRDMSPSAPLAVKAVEFALDEAGINLATEASHVGIYASQYGYLLPGVRELLPALNGGDYDTAGESFKALWDSMDVDPFLLNTSLNNNTLGVLALNWGVAGDSGALLRDALGSSCALTDAIFNLQNHHCDIAIVACAGAEVDILVNDLIRKDDESVHIDTEDELAAVCLVLTRSSVAAQRNLPVKGIIEHFESGYSADVLETGVRQYSTQHPLDAITYDFETPEATAAWQPMVSAINPPQDRCLTEFAGGRGCPGILATAIAGLALHSEDEKIARFMVMSGDADQHMAALGIRNV